MKGLDCYRNILGNMNLSSRPGQYEMIDTICHTLKSDESSVCVIEGGTGTGKGLGYLCGAIPHAIENKQKLIISTGTVQLQKQLVQNDIPSFLAHSGVKASVEIAKGRGRYLCPLKLENQIAECPNEQTLELAQSFNKGVWGGDLDDISRPHNWNELCSNRFDCLGNSCPLKGECPFVKARKRLDDADVIISNHDLTLSDLAMGGAIFSPPENTIYVFDESHHLPEKALNRFSFRYNVKEAVEWASSLKTFLDKQLPLAVSKTGDNLSSLVGNIDAYLSSVEALTQKINQLSFISKTQGQQKVQQNRFPMGVLPDDIRSDAVPCRDLWNDIFGAVNELMETSKEQYSNNPKTLQIIIEELAPLMASAERAKYLWLGFAHQDPPGQTPRARWVNTTGNNDLTLHCGAINASKSLNTFLFSKAAGVVLTSATLLVDQSFESFSREAGIPEDATYLKIESPFDYSNVATLTIPNSSIDPKATTKHSQFIAQYLEQTDLNIGTLVIFSSYKQMEEVYQQLPDFIAEFILLQTQASKDAILQQHKGRIDDGQGSIIFGLQQSWGEGVDLPGKYVTSVIIAKLNFSVPDDPISEAQAEYISSQGKNPFMEILLPQATVKLIQTVGRLIRTESDYGNVTILDNRILKKSYGKMMLNSIPPLRIVT